jgi:hypothetical protein
MDSAEESGKGNVVRLFRKSLKPIHDYTQSSWGHSVNIIRVEKEGRYLDVCGWGVRLEKGDYILLPNKGASTRYRIKNISYYSDPPDMWHATLVFDAR